MWPSHMSENGPQFLCPRPIKRGVDLELNNQIEIDSILTKTARDPLVEERLTDWSSFLPRRDAVSKETAKAACVKATPQPTPGEGHAALAESGHCLLANWTRS